MKCFIVTMVAICGMAHVHMCPTEYHKKSVASSSSAYKEACSETEVINGGYSLNKWSLFGNSIGFNENVLEYVANWYSTMVTSYQSLIDQLNSCEIDSTNSLYIEIDSFRKKISNVYERFESTYQQTYSRMQQRISSLDVNSATYRTEVSNMLIEFESQLKPHYGDLYTLLQPHQTASLIKKIEDYRSSQSTSTTRSTTTQVTQGVSTASSNTAIQFLNNNLELSQIYNLGPKPYLLLYRNQLLPDIDNYIQRLNAIQIDENYSDYETYITLRQNILETYQNFDSLYQTIIDDFESNYESISSLEESLRIQKIRTLFEGYASQLDTYWSTLSTHYAQLPTLLNNWERVSVSSQSSTRSLSEQTTTVQSGSSVNSVNSVRFLDNTIDLNQLNSLGPRQYLLQIRNQNIPNMEDYITRLNSISIDESSCSDVSKLNTYNSFSQNVMQTWNEFNSVYESTVTEFESSYSSIMNLDESQRVTKLNELFTTYDSRLSNLWGTLNGLYTDLPRFLQEYETYSSSQSTTRSLSSTSVDSSSSSSVSSISFLGNTLDLTQLTTLGPQQYLSQYRNQILLRNIQDYIRRLNAIQISRDSADYESYNNFVQNLMGNLGKFDSIYQNIITDFNSNYQSFSNLDESVRIEKIKTLFNGYTNQLNTYWSTLSNCYNQLPTLLDQWEKVSVQSSQSTTRSVQQGTTVGSATSVNSVTEVRFLNNVVDINQLSSLGPKQYLIQYRNNYLANIDDYVNRLKALQIDETYSKYNAYYSFRENFLGLWNDFSVTYDRITEDLVRNYQTIMNLDQSVRIVKLNELFTQYDSQLNSVWYNLVDQYKQLKVNLDEWETYVANNKLRYSKSSRKSARSAKQEQQAMSQNIERSVGSGGDLSSQQYSKSAKSFAESSSLYEEDMSSQNLARGLGGYDQQYSASKKKSSSSSMYEAEQSSSQNVARGLGGYGGYGGYSESEKSYAQSKSLFESEQASSQSLARNLGGSGASSQYFESAASEKSFAEENSLFESSSSAFGGPRQPPCLC